MAAAARRRRAACSGGWSSTCSTRSAGSTSPGATCPLELRAGVAARASTSGIEETDALDYEPAMDDVAHAWDEASLWYGGPEGGRGARRRARGRSTAAVANRSARTSPACASTFRRPRGRVLVLGTGDDLAGRGDARRLPRGGPRRERPVPRLRRGVDAHAVRSPRCSTSRDDDRYEAHGSRAGRGHASASACCSTPSGSDTYPARGRSARARGSSASASRRPRRATTSTRRGTARRAAASSASGMLLDAGGQRRATRVWSDGQGFGGVGGRRRAGRPRGQRRLRGGRRPRR